MGSIAHSHLVLAVKLIYLVQDQQNLLAGLAYLSFDVLLGHVRACLVPEADLGGDLDEDVLRGLEPHAVDEDLPEALLLPGTHGVEQVLQARRLAGPGRPGDVQGLFALGGRLVLLLD